ncbi:MAG: PadR family transcriptional regulator, partial [Candidatus Verstraetearchaeota archaeon]|nr:PadR family transcriptional regulator [Candidatus Verstraetearchaeota archaeon]
MEDSRALKRLKDKLTKENLWLYIVKELAEEPMYAYKVKVVLRERYNINVATVTVYTVLYRMEREGLITKVKGDNTMYRVTERGLEQLNKAIEFMKGVVRSLE